MVDPSSEQLQNAEIQKDIHPPSVFNISILTDVVKVGGPAMQCKMPATVQLIKLGQYCTLTTRKQSYDMAFHACTYFPQISWKDICS